MAERKKSRSLIFHVARGTVWAVASRWTVRFLGFINIIILARILTPDDFGVVTIAMIIAGTIEVFGQTGQWLAIVRHPSPSPEHYDSAWTVSLFLGLVLGIAIWIVAPIAGIYFHETRAVPVLHVIAFRTVISGLENIGVSNFQRDLRFGALAFYNTVPSFMSFVLTIVSAIIFRNYWALVIGIMSQQFMTIVLSYVVEPYRPKLSFAKTGEIWSFSIWTWTRAIGVYLNSQIDKVVIGGFSGASTMGRYEAATDVATIPTLEINTPMTASLFPVMARVQYDIEARRDLYLKVLYLSALICTSTSIGVALVTDDFVDLILGPKWADAKLLVPWLALAFGVVGLSNSVHSALNAIGRPQISAILQWVCFGAFLVSVCCAAYVFRSAESVAVARLVAALLISPVLFGVLARNLELRIRQILSVLWRPIAASVLMAIAVIGADAFLPLTGPSRLVINISLGAAVYFCSILTTWFLVGRPEGPETIIWKFLTGARLALWSPNIDAPAKGLIPKYGESKPEPEE